MSIRYLARCPQFPILIETDSRVVGATNLNEIERLFRGSVFQLKDQYKVIDSTGEGWVFVAKLEALSPLTLKKAWTKQQAIDFFNLSASDGLYFSKYMLT